MWNQQVQEYSEYVARKDVPALLQRKFGRSVARGTLANLASRGEGPRVYRFRLSRDAYYRTEELFDYFGSSPVK